MWRDNMRLADMHIHTTFSPDGKSSMEEQCIKAIEIGIPIICFTDHVDFNSSEINVGRIINKASTNFDVSEYFYEVNRLRRIYNSIQILIGIEFSELHLFPTEFEDYSSMPFDYILGSIHHCYGSVFPGAKNIEESKAIDEYYNLIKPSRNTLEMLGRHRNSDIRYNFEQTSLKNVIFQWFYRPFSSNGHSYPVSGTGLFQNFIPAHIVDQVQKSDLCPRTLEPNAAQCDSFHRICHEAENMFDSAANL